MRITEHGQKYDVMDDSTETGLTSCEWTIVTDPSNGVQYGMTDMVREEAIHHGVIHLGMEYTQQTVLYHGHLYAAGPDGFVWFVPRGAWESAYPLAGMDLHLHVLSVPIGNIHLGWRIACGLSVLHREY